MSRQAIAAALAREDLSSAERLVAFSLASFADRDGRARPGTPAAAGRAGLKRSWFLEAREALERRGLVVVEQAATGRGRASTLWLPFAESGPWWDGEINAELFEAVLSYSRAHGTARLLLAAAAALADEQRVLEGVTTRLLSAAAGLADTTYRRARLALLGSGEFVLHSGNGGRGKANCWELSDPRGHGGEIEPAARRRVAPPPGQRPLLASVSSAPPAAGCSGSVVVEERPDAAEKGSGERALPGANRPVGGGVSAEKGAADRTVSGENRPSGGGVMVEKGAAGRTVSSENPARNPATQRARGKGPQNPRTIHPPNPPQGGRGGDQIFVEETFLTESGRTRRRLVPVDLSEVRSRFRAAGEEDRGAWEQIRRLLLEAVGESMFAMWLEPLELVAVEPDGTLVVSGPDVIVGWGRKRWRRVIERAAGRIERTVRYAEETERMALAPPPPGVPGPSAPLAPAGSQTAEPAAQHVSPSGDTSVSQQADTTSDSRTYTSSYPDVYKQAKEVS